jgi:low temperature requirement protein LtrA
MRHSVDPEVPALAERRAPTRWHPHHIAERYGLFTLIVLGETVSAATVAVQGALDAKGSLGDLLEIAAGGLLIVFAAWWIYFAAPVAQLLNSSRQAFLWGYGHYVVLGSAAAIGAGLEIAVQRDEGHAHISAVAATAAVTVPTALFIAFVWLLHSRHSKTTRAQQLVMPVAAIVVLLCCFIGLWGVLVAGLVCAVTVAIGFTVATRQAAPTRRV